MVIRTTKQSSDSSNAPLKAAARHGEDVIRQPSLCVNRLTIDAMSEYFKAVSSMSGIYRKDDIDAAADAIVSGIESNAETLRILKSYFNLINKTQDGYFISEGFLRQLKAIKEEKGLGVVAGYLKFFDSVHASAPFSRKSMPDLTSGHLDSQNDKKM
jgi:hypothetical protein